MKGKEKKPDGQRSRKKEKFGAPIPTIMTPWGEMSIPEAAQRERDGTYGDPPER